MTANPNITLGQMYCNIHDMEIDNFLGACLKLYELKHACKPANIQLSTADQGEMQEFQGIRVVYDRETPKNHVFMEVAR